MFPDFRHVVACDVYISNPVPRIYKPSIFFCRVIGGCDAQLSPYALAHFVQTNNNNTVFPIEDERRSVRHFDLINI